MSLHKECHFTRSVTSQGVSLNKECHLTRSVNSQGVSLKVFQISAGTSTCDGMFLCCSTYEEEEGDLEHGIVFLGNDGTEAVTVLQFGMDFLIYPTF